MCKFSNLPVVVAAAGGGGASAKAKTTGQNTGAAGGGGGGGSGAKALELCDISDVCARPQCQATSCRFKCSRCELVWYCKAECQRLDWAFHKAKCKTKEKQAEEKAAGMALVVGSLQGRLSLVRTMLERGADVNFVDDDDFTALFCASQNGHLEIVDVLVAAGALVNWARKDDGATAVIMASQQGHHDVVHRLIRGGADVNHCTTDDYADSALMVASQKGHLQCVDVLLAAGAHPRYANHKGTTALDAAKHFKHPQIVALLKAKIAELDRSS